MSRARIQVSIEESALAAIDEAAEAAGENRSEYLCRAALDRAGASGGYLTPSQERAVKRICRQMIASSA